MSHNCEENMQFTNLWNAINTMKDKQAEHDTKIAVLDTHCEQIKKNDIRDLKIRIDTLFGDRKKIAFAIIASLTTFVVSLLVFMWKGNHG